MSGWLRRRYFEVTGSAAASHAIEEAIDELEAIALYNGNQYEVFLRVAEGDGRLYVDLGGPDGHCVEIARGRWRVLDRAPVRFRRSPSHYPMPEPTSGGTVDELRRFLNVEGNEASFRIIIAWLLAAFRPRGPYPVLNIRAEQGAAKTTTARVIRRLIDPAKALEIGVPRDLEALILAAHHHHVVSIDNVSSIPRWLSDDLSRLATGAGIPLRRKYSTLDELALELCRPIILNGIEDFVSAEDLADRAWTAGLPALPDARKRSESAFESEFVATQPRLLGAILDAVAAAHEGADLIDLTKPTRMVDATRFAVAAHSILGWPLGALEDDLDEMRAGSRSSALEASSLTAPLVELGDEGRWEGTAVELLAELEDRAGAHALKRVDWPNTPRGLSGHLRRLAPALRRERGIELTFDVREPHTRRRLILLERLGDSTVPTVPPVPPDHLGRGHRG